MKRSDKQKNITRRASGFCAKARIRPGMFESVYRDLRSAGYCYITVYHGEGMGRRGDPDKLNASLEFPFLHSKVVKIEIIVADNQQKEVFNIIQQAACTHHKVTGLFTVQLLIKRSVSEQVKKEKL